MATISPPDIRRCYRPKTAGDTLPASQGPGWRLSRTAFDAVGRCDPASIAPGPSPRLFPRDWLHITREIIKAKDARASLGGCMKHGVPGARVTRRGGPGEATIPSRLRPLNAASQVNAMLVVPINSFFKHQQRLKDANPRHGKRMPSRGHEHIPNSLTERPKASKPASPSHTLLAHASPTQGPVLPSAPCIDSIAGKPPRPCFWIGSFDGAHGASVSLKSLQPLTPAGSLVPSCATPLRPRQGQVLVFTCRIPRHD